MCSFTHPQSDFPNKSVMQRYAEIFRGSVVVRCALWSPVVQTSFSQQTQSHSQSLLLRTHIGSVQPSLPIRFHFAPWGLLDRNLTTVHSPTKQSKFLSEKEPPKSLEEFTSDKSSQVWFSEGNEDTFCQSQNWPCKASDLVCSSCSIFGTSTARRASMYLCRTHMAWPPWLYTSSPVTSATPSRCNWRNSISKCEIQLPNTSSSCPLISVNSRV